MACLTALAMLSLSMACSDDTEAIADEADDAAADVAAGEVTSNEDVFAQGDVAAEGDVAMDGDVSADGVVPVDTAAPDIVPASAQSRAGLAVGAAYATSPKYSTVITIGGGGWMPVASKSSKYRFVGGVRAASEGTP